jgi:MFS family permease
VGPALASALLPVIGPHWLLAADAVSFLASAAAVMVLRRRVVEPQRPGAGGRRSVRGLTSAVGDGLRFIFGDPVLRPQFIVYPAMESATYAIVFLLPGLVRHAFSASSWLFGLLLAANAAGRVAGAWLVGHARLKTRRGWILAGNFVAQGVAMAIFAVAPSAWEAALLLGLAGLPSGAAQVALSGYLQTEVPMEMRGRCFAAITSFSTWLMPLGPLLFGALAEWHGDRFAFAAIAVAFLAGGAFICSHRSVREVR